MSTTFGIHKHIYKEIIIEDDCPIIDDDTDNDFIVVAFRGNTVGISWRNELAPFLPDEMKVYALDNTQQGIYTIGDIKNKIILQQ